MVNKFNLTVLHFARPNSMQICACLESQDWAAGPAWATGCLRRGSVRLVLNDPHQTFSHRNFGRFTCRCRNFARATRRSSSFQFLHVLFRCHVSLSELTLTGPLRTWGGMGGACTYSLAITVRSLCFWHFPTQFVHGCKGLFTRREGLPSTHTFVLIFFVVFTRRPGLPG